MTCVRVAALGILALTVGCSDSPKGDAFEAIEGGLRAIAVIPDSGQGYLLEDVVAGSISGSGEILLLDAGRQTVWMFDASGAPIGRVGRAGEGPGEFSPWLGAVGFLGSDSVSVVDLGQVRFMGVARSDGGGSGVQLPRVAGMRTPEVRWRIADGGGSIMTEHQDGGVVRLMRWERNDTFQAVWTWSTPWPPRKGGPGGVPIQPLLSAELLWDWEGGTGYAISSVGDTLIDLSGSRPPLVIPGAAVVEVDDGIKEKLAERWRTYQAARGVRAVISAMIELAYPTVLPTFSALHFDPNQDEVWLTRAPELDSISPGPWLIEHVDRIESHVFLIVDLQSAELRIARREERGRILDVRDGRALLLRYDFYGRPIVEVMEWEAGQRPEDR